jgi:hypothetical protein
MKIAALKLGLIVFFSSIYVGTAVTPVDSPSHGTDAFILTALILNIYEFLSLF